MTPDIYMGMIGSYKGYPAVVLEFMPHVDGVYVSVREPMRWINMFLKLEELGLKSEIITKCN